MLTIAGILGRLNITILHIKWKLKTSQFYTITLSIQTLSQDHTIDTKLINRHMKSYLFNEEKFTHI